MIVQSKKVIPEVYSQSYDMSIFTGLLDLIYTARQIDLLRIQNAHSPKQCFDEDVPKLASFFNLGLTSNRELIQKYRILIKNKGTPDALLAAAQLSNGLEAIVDKAKYTKAKSTVITTDDYTTVIIYTDLSSMDYILFDTLMSRLAPADVFVQLRPLEEYTE